MEDDEGLHSVVVPLSLIQALTFEMLHTIDQWYEDRQIEELSVEQCFVAMTAATQAVIEMLNDAGDEITLQ